MRCHGKIPIAQQVGDVLTKVCPGPPLSPVRVAVDVAVGVAAAATFRAESPAARVGPSPDGVDTRGRPQIFGLASPVTHRGVSGVSGETLPGNHKSCRRWSYH